MIAAAAIATTAFGLAATTGAYTVSIALRRHWASPFTTPVLASTLMVIGVLLATEVSFTQYKPAYQAITSLLAPATVALAIPIYKNRHVFFRNLLPAGCGLVAGSLSTMITAGLLARFFGFSPDFVASISIKSATTPIAVEIAKFVGGNSSMTAIFAVTTGVIGAALGPWLLDRLGIASSMARGLALGTISHGIGTAQAAGESDIAGATAGVAMGLGALCTALAAPLIVPLLTG
jgi:putative effector of murein hydrolase